MAGQTAWGACIVVQTFCFDVCQAVASMKASAELTRVDPLQLSSYMKRFAASIVLSGRDTKAQVEEAVVRSVQ